MNLFVSKLKELLLYSGKMQKNICSEMGISKQKLSKWKTGYNEPSLDELIMIARYFNVSTDFLLGLEEYPLVKSDNLNNIVNNNDLK